MRAVLPTLLFCTALAVLLACGGAATVPAHAAPNPFVTKPSGPAPNNRIAVAMPQFMQPFIQKISLLQEQLRMRMSALAQDIRSHTAGRAFWMFLLLAFAYGALHALGPGHGKVFAASYFLHRPGGLRQALLYGNIAMATHVVSATTLVLTGYYLLKTSAQHTVDTLGAQLETVSYSLLLVVGLGLTIKTLFELKRKRPQHERTASSGTSRKSLFLTAIASGIIPCPGAALVLIFALSLNIPLVGFLAMACIALGMGLSISCVAAIIITTRGAALKLAQNHQTAFNTLHTAITLAGALAITLLGAVLLLGHLA